MSDLFVSTRLGFRSAAGEPLWTVHRWRGDRVLGGDHHWVRERYALRAAALYREHPELHGQPESVLRDHGMVFDSDADATGIDLPTGQKPRCAFCGGADPKFFVAPPRDVRLPSEDLGDWSACEGCALAAYEAIGCHYYRAERSS